MIISALQLAVGAFYVIKPQISFDDFVNMLPPAFCFMGAHSASISALSTGAVSFGQIIKSAEPAFAAVFRQIREQGQVALLPIVIGGVIFVSVKELDFTVSALVSACIANLSAVVKGNENKKLMGTANLKDRLVSVGNQFAVTINLGSPRECGQQVCGDHHPWLPLEHPRGAAQGGEEAQDKSGHVGQTHRVGPVVPYYFRHQS